MNNKWLKTLRLENWTIEMSLALGGRRGHWDNGGGKQALMQDMVLEH